MQVLFQQHNLRGIGGSGGGAPQRDRNIGLLQGRGIVDAVAHIADGAAGGLRDFLLTSKAAVAAARAAGATALPPAQREELAATYQRITDDALATNPAPAEGWPRSNVCGRPQKPKARNLAEQFDQERTKILAFLDDFNVPFDNNLAERNLRMLKVQQKISGCFRSWDGAVHATAVRSYLSTMRKQGHNPLHVLSELFAGRLLAPSLSA